MEVISMKILGLSFGTKNGNNDTMYRVALEAAQKMGAEIEFIHVFDWDIKFCSGCVACSRGLVMGKGMICTQKDDYAALYEKMVEADGVLVVDPIYESGGSGLFHAVCDRMDPGHDTGMLMMLDGKLKEQGKEGLNPRMFMQKAISFVGIGGSDWAYRVQTDHAMLALSPGWKVVDNDFFSWSKDVIMQDDKVARMQEIGKNPMQMPQFLLPAAVLTIIFTVPMTLVMTAVGLKMGGQPMNIYWFAFLGTLPKMLIAAYISVMIFLPLSMKVSGMDKLGGPPPKG